MRQQFNSNTSNMELRIVHSFLDNEISSTLRALTAEGHTSTALVVSLVQLLTVSSSRLSLMPGKLVEFVDHKGDLNTLR